MPSFATLRAIGGGAKAAGQSLQDLIANRHAQEQLRVLEEEGQRRQQSLDDYRNSQQAKIDYDIEQDRLQRQRLEEFLKNPNLTQEQRMMVEYALATGQSAAKGAFEDPEAADRRLQNELGTRHIYAMELADKQGRGTAGERAIPPDFAAAIAQIRAENPDGAKGLKLFDEQLNSGQFFDRFGYGINPSAGRNMLADLYRREQLAKAQPPGRAERFITRKWDEFTKRWSDVLPPEFTESGGVTPPAKLGGTPAPPPGAPPGWHPPMSIVPGLRAIPEVPFSFGEETPLEALPRSFRGAPSKGGPSGEEIWKLLEGAGRPGEPELPSAETIFNMLNERANRAPTKQGITTGRARVKPKGKGKPVKLRERLQIEGYDVIPMR